VLTFGPPQSSSVADIAPQDTQNHVAASSMPYTKSVTHALTQKTYLANQNKMCPKHAQKVTPDGSVSSTPGPYHSDRAGRLPFHCRIAQTNSTISELSQESNPMAPSNIFHTFLSSFHKPFSCQALLLSFEPHQEIPHDHRSSPNRNVLYANDNDMSQFIKGKYNG
jgi:hypothetical protein